MTNLLRQSGREMLSLREAMDRLLEDSFVRMGDFPFAGSGAGLTNALAVDLFETDNDFQLKVAVPGIRPEDVEVTLTGDVLTIRGETREEQEHKEASWRQREWRYGKFERDITLPATVNADAIEAKYDNGVLTLRLPKTEAVKPKRLQVKTK
jgi:HSP20 family protein